LFNGSGDTRQDLLRKKRQENERKKDKDRKEKELIVNEVQYYGFWQYTETVGQMLKTYKTAVLKKGALKAQLRFRKTILEQMADKSLFMFSEKGKEHINSRIIIIHYIEPFRVSRDYRNNSTIIWLTISIFPEIVPYTFPKKDRLDKSLFMFSEKGKEHSVEKLKNNLLSLIDISLKINLFSS
jgi:hypothetical protein